MTRTLSLLGASLVLTATLLATSACTGTGTEPDSAATPAPVATSPAPEPSPTGSTTAQSDPFRPTSDPISRRSRLRDRRSPHTACNPCKATVDHVYVIARRTGGGGGGSASITRTGAPRLGCR